MSVPKVIGQDDSGKDIVIWEPYEEYHMRKFYNEVLEHSAINQIFWGIKYDKIDKYKLAKIIQEKSNGEYPPAYVELFNPENANS